MAAGTRRGGGVGSIMPESSAAAAAPTDIIDPHCVPVVPGHDLLIHALPNGNVLLTLVTHQVDTDGRVVGVVTCRVEWERAALRAAHARLIAMLEAGDLAFIPPINVLPG